MAIKKRPQKLETLELRDRLKELLSRELDRLPELLEGMHGKNRFDAILRLMPLIIPKAKPVKHDIKENDGWGW